MRQSCLFQAGAEAGLAHPDNLSVLRDTQGIWINWLVEEGLSNLMLHYLFQNLHAIEHGFSPKCSRTIGIVY